MRKKETKTEATSKEEILKTKRATRTRKKAETKPAEEPQKAPAAPEEIPEEKPAPKKLAAEKPTAEKLTAEKPATERPAPEKPAAEKPVKKRAPRKKKQTEEPANMPEAKERQETPEKPAAQEAPAPKPIVIPVLQNVKVQNFCDLANQTGKIPILNDQQIQMLTWEEAQRRCEMLENILCAVLDYDIVLSDTNIWIELLVGHSSSHSDPRVNARLQFERQLESISKMMKRIGGRFMVMSETYEEIDRFATAQEPVNYKDADWSDEALCRNVAARLAKRLMLAQQKENRLRIEGIGSESHHESFADPAIIRRTVEFFATGKKVLLLTNDTSVGIRSLGMCDDLQRVNGIDDHTWRTVYEPQRPMVLTMDDLKLLDNYMRHYHYLCAAAGRSWMQDAPRRETAVLEKPLELWLEGFRPGNRKERRSDRKEQERAEQERREQERREQQRRADRERAERERADRERAERERTDRERAERERADKERAERERADKERAEARRRADQEEARQKAAEQKAEPASPADAPAPAEKPAPTEEQMPGAETSAPEEKRSRSRRGGRGRRSGKKNDESTANQQQP